MESSLCEKPERHASRRLSDHLTFEGQKKKVHSLVDKVYSRETLKLAWERVRSDSRSLRTPCPPARYPAGRRGITPAFGYSAPHPNAGGTLTLLIHALPSAHYGRV